MSLDSDHLAAGDSDQDFRDGRASSQAASSAVQSGRPITITATVAAWLPSTRMPHELLNAVRAGKHAEAISMVWLWGTPDKASFSSNPRIGTATVTLELAPEDEQVAMACKTLRDKLEEERTKWLATQQAILDQINKLQAITFDAGEA